LKKANLLKMVMPEIKFHHLQKSL